MTPSKPDQWGEWQEHDGSECPIPDAKAGEFEIKFRDERIRKSSRRAVWWGINWKHLGSPHDIIAYRVRVKS